MNSIILLIALISFLLSLVMTQQSNVYLHYSELFGSFYTVIRVGNPIQLVLEGVNLAHPFTLTTDFFFNINKSTTIQILESSTPSFVIDTKSYEGTRLSDKISFLKSDAFIEGYNFYVIKNNQFDHKKIRTGFSLANKFTDLSFSLVHLLKESNFISHLSFAIVPNNYYGIISFGGIDPDLVMNKTLSKCKVNNLEPFIAWSCHLSHVFLGELSFDNPSKNIYNYNNNKDYAYFQSSTKAIIAPKRFIDFIYKELLNALIKKGKCFIEKTTKSPLKCSIGLMPLMPNITFIFDSISYSFNLTDFFECLIDWCEILIIQNEDDSWMFGTVFIRKFIMNFDYEDNTITFYSNETRISVDIDKLIPIRYWIWLCVVFGAVFIAFYAFYAFYTYIHLKKYKNQKNIGGPHNQKYIEKDYHNIQ